jgi:hypothetical protein
MRKLSQSLDHFTLASKCKRSPFVNEASEDAEGLLNAAAPPRHEPLSSWTCFAWEKFVICLKSVYLGS